MNGLSILGTGRCLPEKIVTNEDWSKQVDTDDAWIVSRTGIKKRHFVCEETNADLAEKAAALAIEQAGISSSEIGICIVATFTPDDIMPSVASALQARLSLANDTPCFDLNAACSGFIYALKMAQAYLWSIDKRYALVVGSEVISKTLDIKDRTSCILFGDGAGAVVVEKSESPFFSSLGTASNRQVLYSPANYAKEKLQMVGKDVFRFAVDVVPKEVRTIVNIAQVELDEIDYIVCHQANERIIRGVANRLSLPIEKFYMNIENYGNTSAASIPIALDEMNRKEMLTAGKKIICVGFGGGLTYGSVYLQF